LVDNASGKVLSAVKLYDKEDTFYFDNDTALSPLIQNSNETRAKFQGNHSTWTSWGLREDWGFNHYGGDGYVNQMHNTAISIRAEADGTIHCDSSCIL